VAVVGESGCGKSTLLDLLGLVLPAGSANRFEFDPGSNNMAINVLTASERKLAKLRRQHLGYVLQGGGLLPFLKVEHNVLLATLLRRAPSSQNLPLSAFGIAEQSSKKPQHLSGGQRQRVAIARALAGYPEVILADEPTASVDHPTARRLCELLAEHVKERKTTVVMVTHDRNLLEGIANRWLTFDVAASEDGLVVRSQLREAQR
jgi:putative ABC transport system ATP-binding protein